MFAFTPGNSPANVVRASLAAVAAASLSGCLTGCVADSNAAYYANAPVVAAYVAKAPGVEVEDDGLPSQTSPSTRIRQMPDDPTEPYSRNYGGPNPSATGPAPAASAHREAIAKPIIPADLPPAFRSQLVAAVANAE
jgi:hypothetical protein